MTKLQAGFGGKDKTETRARTHTGTWMIQGSLQDTPGKISCISNYERDAAADRSSFKGTFSYGTS
jgi:hypothetical protein